jgi:hypothetical protein
MTMITRMGISMATWSMILKLRTSRPREAAHFEDAPVLAGTAAFP